MHRLRAMPEEMSFHPVRGELQDRRLLGDAQADGQQQR